MGGRISAGLRRTLLAAPSFHLLPSEALRSILGTRTARNPAPAGQSPCSKGSQLPDMVPAPDRHCQEVLVPDSSGRGESSGPQKPRRTG